MRSLLRDLALGMAAFVAVQFYGCASAKPVIRSAWDIARDLCHVIAGENADKLSGMSVEQYCEIADNLTPFVDQILAAERAGIVHMSRMPYVVEVPE